MSCGRKVTFSKVFKATWFIEPISQSLIVLVVEVSKRPCMDVQLGA